MCANRTESLVLLLKGRKNSKSLSFSFPYDGWELRWRAEKTDGRYRSRPEACRPLLVLLLSPLWSRRVETIDKLFSKNLHLTYLYLFSFIVIIADNHFNLLSFISYYRRLIEHIHLLTCTWKATCCSQSNMRIDNALTS